MSEASVKTAVWCVMPAAGSGSRMQLELPKQYLQIHGKAVIEYSIGLILSLAELQSVLVCLPRDDARFKQLNIATNKRVQVTHGGATRADSVLNGLRFLSKQAGPNDWVLVHDAARPCLSPALLRNLVDSLRDEDVGGILAVPAKDTLKRTKADAAAEKQYDADSHPSIDSTLDRSRVWQAQTPQMFRFGALREALEHCQRNGLDITDEASALEHLGHHPKLIEGSAQNIKITTPEDLLLAEFLLTQV